jgi:pimeloyl-ACP methyl ester carboxylesterase
MHAVGPDVGTSALLFAAAQKPELFESIVCGAGATSVDLAGPLLRDLILSPPGHFSSIEGGAFVVELIRGATAKVIPDAVIEDYRASSAGDRFENATAYVRAYQSDLPALAPLLTGIKTPVLVLAGKNDPVVPPPNGELLVKSLPHCRQALLDAGHFAWEDQAGVYANELVSWIQGGYRAV